jgi:hypothetical protein
MKKNKVLCYTDFNLRDHREKILKTLDCSPDNPAYEIMIEVYEEMYKKAMQIVKPLGVVRLEDSENKVLIKEAKNSTEIIYTCCTLGKEIQKLITCEFEKGNYLEGMLLDALADEFIFQVQDQIYHFIYMYLKEKQLGAKKFSPGEQGFDIAYHKLLEEKLHMKDNLNISLTDFYMLNPVKSLSAIFVADKLTPLRKKIHDCKECSNLTCKWRQVSYASENYTAM